MSLDPERVSEIKRLVEEDVSGSLWAAFADRPDGWYQHVSHGPLLREYLPLIDPATVRELCEAWESLSSCHARDKTHVCEGRQGSMKPCGILCGSCYDVDGRGW